jgi:glycosidase
MAAFVAACGASSGGVHGPTFDVDGGATTSDGGVAGDGSAPQGDGGVLDAANDAAPSGNAADPNVWRPQVIYLAMTDRFFDGDTSNDAAGQAGCFDQANAALFHGGDLAGLRQKIPYLRDLGVTAVWITPLYAQTPLRNGACGYHGYWADYTSPDDGAIEPKMGTVADATALVNDLHAAGMKLVLDMVVNHSGRNARIVTQQPTWFHDAATCASLGDTKIYCPLNGLPDFAQENATVAAYLSALSRAWIDRVKPDGVRMDTAQHVPASYFASSWFPAVRASRGDLFTVAEIFNEGAYSDFLPELDAGFDSAFDYPLYAALVSAIAGGGSLDLIADKTASAIATWGLARAQMKTSFIDNHDVPRFLTSAPAGTATNELVARYGLALATLFTLPGIPQLYYGDELGMVGATTDNRRDMPSWAWDAASRAMTHAGYVPNSQTTYALTQSLIAIRTQNAALSSGGYKELWRPNGGENLYAFHRSAGTSRILVVLHNDAGSPPAAALPFATVGGIAQSDRDAWPDGTVLEDLLHAGAPATLTVTAGKIPIAPIGKVAGIYRAR